MLSKGDVKVIFIGHFQVLSTNQSLERSYKCDLY